MMRDGGDENLEREKCQIVGFGQWEYVREPILCCG